ncbi:MAG: histidine kinase [Armatimonadetes bacterium]|nr:histidine kinase [Armatimonadota bacterium]
MKLRTRLLLLLGAAILCGVLLSTAIVYVVARQELETLAKRGLEDAARFFSHDSDAWAASFKADSRLWSVQPLVSQVADGRRDRTSSEALNRFFRQCVQGKDMYESVSLMSGDGEVLASSYSRPEEVGLLMVDSLPRDPSFAASRAGNQVVSPAYLGDSGQRVCVALYTPVPSRRQGSAVLRAALDLGRINERLMQPLPIGKAGRAYIFDPGLTVQQLKGQSPQGQLVSLPNMPHNIPALREMLTKDHGIAKYQARRGIRMAAYRRLHEAGLVLVVELPLREVLAPIKSIQQVTFLVAVIILALVWGAVYLIANPLAARIQECQDLARDIQDGHLDRRLAITTGDEIGLLTGGLNAMAETLQQNRDDLEKAEQDHRRMEEAERLLVESRLRTLRYQINPHFLFNVINSIDALAHEAPERVHTLVRELARYLRFSLQWREESVVPLQLELEAIESYLQVEKVRFEENLEVQVEASNEARTCAVPILLLQPLVQNAIKYGMETSVQPLRLKVSAVVANGELHLAVANSGRWVEPGTSSSRKQTRLGLENLRKRLELLYPERHTLDVGAVDNWVVGTIHLPAENADRRRKDLGMG